MQKKLTIYSFESLAVLLLCVLASVTLQAQNAYFSVVGGMPHLPVLVNTAAVLSPVAGAMIFSTADGTVMFYSGATDGWQKWCTAKPALPLGAYTNFTVTAAGIPCLPVSAVNTGVGQAGALYYPSGGAGLLLNNGADWFTPKLLLATPTTNAYTMAGNIAGYTTGGFAMPVKPTDPTFVDTDKGTVYLNSTDQKLHVNDGTVWLSVTCANCPSTMTVTHTVPITLTITYGVYDDATNKLCWITRNLGASNQAATLTDATEEALGFLYAWGNSQSNSPAIWGSTLGNHPTSGFLTTSQDWGTYDWPNDPCKSAFVAENSAWRVANDVDWATISAQYTTEAACFAAPIKLHDGGYSDATSSTTLSVISGGMGVWHSSTPGRTFQYSYYYNHGQLMRNGTPPAPFTQKGMRYDPVRCVRNY